MKTAGQAGGYRRGAFWRMAPAGAIVVIRNLTGPSDHRAMVYHDFIDLPA